MKIKNSLLCALCLSLVFGVVSCRKGKKSYDEIGESGLTTRTENLQANLLAYENQGVLIGQLYGTTEGIGWQGDSARSDFKEVCDDMPACIGFELGGVESNKKMNADSVDFNLIRRSILDFFHRQGLVVMTWTAPNPGSGALEDGSKANTTLRSWVKNVARYLSSLQNGYGIKVPVVLALYPAGANRWYDHMSAADYKKLYTQTVVWLKEDTVTNALFAFSNSELVQKPEEFVTRCPEENIDVVQLAYITNNYEGYTDNLQRMCGMLSAWCSQQMKAFGIVTGVKGLGNDDNFWSTNILPVVQNCRASYLMLGRNHGDFEQGNFYGVYPGNGSAPDFVKLCNTPRALFMSKVNGLLLNHKEKDKK